MCRVFIPQRRENWKEDSTEKTTLERYKNYLFSAFERFELRDLTRDKLQQFLKERATSGLSRSVVDHLRWDLNAIFKMAAEDGLVKGNPAGSLVTPREAKRHKMRNMTKEEYNLGLSVLDVRERLIYRLAGLVGLRPGEIMALRWGRIKGAIAEIGERVYRGSRGDPKTDRSRREKRRFHRSLRPTSRHGVRFAWTSVTTRWYFRPNGAPFCPAIISCGGTSRKNWPRWAWLGSISRY